MQKAKEVQIDVPWGHIAGKWWGPQTVRPIVALHGREQNAGSFDCLIPLLPDHVSYLAIDLPGHGLSSTIPLGQVYSTDFYVYVLHLIRIKYQWEKISLLGHSMSSVHSFIYASLFPDEVDMIIGISFLRPHVLTPSASVEVMQRTLNNTVQADLRAQQYPTREPPAYEYEEMVRQTMKLIRSNRVPAEIMLRRGIFQSKTDSSKFCYSRDRRVQKYFFTISRKVSLEMARRIKFIPHCFIKGCNEEQVYNEIENKSHFDEAVALIQEINPDFECHLIDGGHFVHLVEIHPTAEIISAFIRKYRPPSIVSKI